MENNFIGIHPNAASKEYCERIIRRFEFLKETKSGGRGKIWTRQEHTNANTSKLEKDDSSYFIGGDNRDDLPFEEEDVALLGVDGPLLKDFTTIVW